MSSSTVVGEDVPASVEFARDSEADDRRVEVPASLSLRGELDFLSIISGGGRGRRNRPAT